MATTRRKTVRRQSLPAENGPTGGSRMSAQDRDMPTNVPKPYNYNTERWTFGIRSIVETFLAILLVVWVFLHRTGWEFKIILILAGIIWLIVYGFFIAHHVWHWTGGYKAKVFESIRGREKKLWESSTGITPGLFYGDTMVREFDMTKAICTISIGKDGKPKEYSLRGGKVRRALEVEVPCFPYEGYLVNLGGIEPKTLEKITGAHVDRNIQEELGGLDDLPLGLEGIDCVYQTMVGVFGGKNRHTGFEKANGIKIDEYIVSNVAEPSKVQEGRDTVTVVNAITDAAFASMKRVERKKGLPPGFAVKVFTDAFNAAKDIERARLTQFFATVDSAGNSRGPKRK